MARKVLSGPALVGAAGAVTTIATSAVVNVWTDGWSWVAFAAVVGLTATSVAIAVLGAGPAKRDDATVSQSASAGGRISGSRLRARRGAHIAEGASNRGVIRGSTVDAKTGRVRVTSDDGVIEDSTITTD
ncbi:hypothetical protein [Rhizomonospora bruguierae]|uniref:hypothetical protein n=1 Tax=Rhizomonospora bruguierae TaxID=1581705 RepID=UPI001BCE9086|nr:hypothetical protein [Micromonospora sp. NBRC 107566]